MGKERSSATGDNGQDARATQQHSKASKQTTKKPSKKHDSSKSTLRFKSDEEESHSESESSAGEFDFDLPCEEDWYEPLKVDLQAGGRRFWLDEKKLREFSILSSKLDRASNYPQRKRWKLLVLKEDANDVYNMLEVLHATPYQSKNFDVQTLKSTLKLATKYEHPELRSYAIRQLDQYSRSLAAIDRFALSREYNVCDWMAGAIDELCTRGEPITEPESLILGPGVLTRIAAKREKLQYERGKNARINQTPKLIGMGIVDSPPTTPRPIRAIEGPFALSTPAVTPQGLGFPLTWPNPLWAIFNSCQLPPPYKVAFGKGIYL